MIKKKILGIYADRDSLHYVSVGKGISGYALKSPGHGHGSHKTSHGNGYTLLRSFLTELPVDSSRDIYLALSRAEIFIREIDIPAMPVEDALMSIKNSLAIYSHLEPDSIYYDVIVSDQNGGSFHALLVYASKDEMEKYRKLFSETGHGTSLKGIFPLSYGVCALIDDGALSDGETVSLIQDDIIEIFVRSGKTLVFSMSCPVDAEDEKKMILSAASNKFPQFKEMVNELSSDSCPSKYTDQKIAKKSELGLTKTELGRKETELGSGWTAEQKSQREITGKDSNNRGSKKYDRTKDRQAKGKKRTLSYLPHFSTNRASAAVAPFITKIQQISLDEQPVKINIIHPFRYILPFLCVLIAILYFVTDKANTASIEAKSQLNEITQQVTALENDLEPLQNKIDTLKKASRFKTDVQEFMQTRPALYTVINEIASLVPDGTWFANFTFNNSGITLRGTGRDALKTVESLRSSKLFDNVILRGSVNRRPNGDESFTLAIDIKPPEPDISTKNPEPDPDFKKENAGSDSSNPESKSSATSSGLTKQAVDAGSNPFTSSRQPVKPSGSVSGGVQ
ncbi:MAG: PilN domain-containing protein [Desulfamplus sp.]|nr:PilN domain-containing protein [Desulfamplus sp.]